MAFDNEIQEVLADISKGRDYIRISKISNSEDNSLKAIDIRQHYVGDDDELYPTKKGLRIPASKIQDVAKVLSEIEVPNNGKEENPA